MFEYFSLELYGLMTFLGVEPFYVRVWWQKLLWIKFINGDTQPMIDVVSRFIWRTTKIQVRNQVGYMIRIV